MTDPTTGNDFRNDDDIADGAFEPKPKKVRLPDDNGEDEDEDQPAGRHSRSKVPPTNAPGRQVGGTHYQATFQHWDWVEHNGLGYLEGQITRYVMRWRNKDGVQGLEKAIHCTDKLIELASTKGRKNRATRPTGFSLHGTRSKEFFLESKLSPPERSICLMVLHWKDTTTLEDVKEAIQALVDGATPQQVLPKTDGGKTMQGGAG